MRDMIDYKKLTAALMSGVVMMFSAAGCTMPWESAGAAANQESDSGQNAAIEDIINNSDSDLTLEFDAEDLDASWQESDADKITLNGSSASVTGSGASVSGSVVTITAAGTYVLSGTLSEGQIVVNCTTKGTVRLILNGATISNSSAAPVVVMDAKKVLITLADGTNNVITDSARAAAQDEDYSGAVSSKADLVFNGTGTLNVTANYRNGIKSSDDLKIVSGSYQITSKEDGMIGKDLLGIKNGSFVIQAGADGMKSTYDTDTTKGNIILEGGEYHITSANDGIQAENILVVRGGTYDIKTGEGAANAITKTNAMGMTGGSRFGGDFSRGNTAAATETDTESLKGLKAANAIVISNGTFVLDCEDDGIHSNGAISIDGGTYTINSGDDGIHADESIQINNGTIDIQTSYEGIEAAQITLNGGELSVKASDDGLNASNGDSVSSMPGGGMNMQKAPGNTTSESTSAISLNINGGKLYVNADGDGLDSNGTVTMTGGEVIVLGPTDNSNTALDFETGFAFSGGTLMAFGSSGMLETPTSAENGCCLVAAFTTQSADTEFVLKDASGNTIMSYVPTKSYSAAIVYSAGITSGNTYTMNAGSASVSITANEGVTANTTNGMGGFGGQGNIGGQGKDGFGAEGGNMNGKGDMPDDNMNGFGGRGMR